MKEQKSEPWRIVVAILSIGFIIYMWVEKDVAAISQSITQRNMQKKY